MELQFTILKQVGKKAAEVAKQVESVNEKNKLVVEPDPFTLKHWCLGLSYYGNC